MNFSWRVGLTLRLSLTVSLLGLACARLAQGQITFYQPPSSAGGDFVADFNGDGIPDLMGTNGGLLLGNGDGTFRDGTPVSGGAVAVGDFNGDGKPDVLQLGTGGPLNGTLLVLLGNGDGTFQAPIMTYAYVLQGVIAGDLNGDGNADVVGYESTNSNATVVVYLSRGDGTFAPGVPYTISNAPNADLITLGDFNGDHITDIAVSLYGGQEVVLLGNGDGTFQSGKTSTGVSNPYLAIPGDFNDDGKLDLMLSGELLLGNGDGTFQPPTPVANGVAQAAADFNGDGKLDLVVAPGVIEICLGNGDGTFSNSYNYIENLSGIGFASSFVVADFNLDGKLDIAGGGYVLLGNGDGSFQGGLLTQLIIATSAVAASFDKKGNGFEDVAEISSTSLYSLTNDGKGNLSLSNTYTLQEPSWGIATADLNGDGLPDLVVAGTDPISQDWSYSSLLGNGDGSFQAPQFYPQSVVGAGNKVQYSMVIADFNNDHKLDVAVGPVGTQSLAVLLGNGDGSFASPAYIYDGGGNSNTTYLMAADFNGDGNVDIAASPLGTEQAGTAILFGNGDGTFQPAIFPLGYFTAYGTADFNHDGKADLWGEGTRGCQVLLGNGDGTFTAQTPFSPYCLLPIVVTDINGDGILDVVADYYHPFRLGGGYNDYWAYLGNGDGTFELPIEIPTAFASGSVPTFELAVDMNGDGKPDLISNAGTGYTFVLLNTTVSAPVVTFSPSTVTFPSQIVGTSSGQAPVTLTNTGAVALTVTSITISGTNASEFSQTNNCTKVQPNAKCTIKITFTPTVVGTASASVIVADNAGSGSQTIPLSGTGAAAATFAIAPAPGSPTSATIAAGNKASFNLAITPSGSFSGTVNLVCGISPAVMLAPTCALPGTVQVNTGTPANIAVTVNTIAATSAGTVGHGNFPEEVMPIALTVFLFTSALLLVVNRRRWPALAAPVLALALNSIAGCGGSNSTSSSSGTPANTYTVTVTATSGSLTSKTTLTVIVQ